MKRISDIFSRWPTDAAFGRDIGMPYPTVSAWKQRGAIPAAYWRDIIRAARQRGHPEITADLLVELHAREPKTELAGAGVAEKDRPFEAEASPSSANDNAKRKRAGHFSRFKHLRRDHFRTAAEIEEHIRKLRDEWSHR